MVEIVKSFNLFLAKTISTTGSSLYRREHSGPGVLELDAKVSEADEEGESSRLDLLDGTDELGYLPVISAASQENYDRFYDYLLEEKLKKNRRSLVPMSEIQIERLVQRDIFILKERLSGRSYRQILEDRQQQGDRTLKSVQAVQQAFERTVTLFWDWLARDGQVDPRRKLPPRPKRVATKEKADGESTSTSNEGGDRQDDSKEQYHD